MTKLIGLLRVFSPRSHSQQSRRQVRMLQDVAEERIGLLAHDASGHATHVKSCRNGRNFPNFPNIHPVTYCMLLYFLVGMHDLISDAPLTALLEQKLCREYYIKYDRSLIAPGGSIDERFCKLNAVQSELAIVRGWSLASNALPGKTLSPGPRDLS